MTSSPKPTNFRRTLKVAIKNYQSRVAKAYKLSWTLGRAEAMKPLPELIELGIFARGDDVKAYLYFSKTYQFISNSGILRMGRRAKKHGAVLMLSNITHFDRWREIFCSKIVEIGGISCEDQGFRITEANKIPFFRLEYTERGIRYTLA